MQSLAVVRTGLEGEQTKMDVISNNLANLNTTGFKRMRPVFADLLYEDQTQAGGFTSQATNYPSGLQQGTGANVVATEPIVTQGSLEQTGNALDLAINGQGYFQVLLPSGQLAYTRDGSFQISAQGQVVTAKGYQLQPSITIPRNAQSVTIGTDGTVSVQIQGQSQPSQVGLIQLANFINPEGLQFAGDNLAIQTQASGAPITGQPSQNGLGTVAQGYLEGSNVSVVDEMIDMIATQRAYELNTAGRQKCRSDAQLSDPDRAVRRRRSVSPAAVLLVLGGGLGACQNAQTARDNMLASLQHLPGDTAIESPTTNGAIYHGYSQGGAELSLFRDHRPWQVGDIVTVQVTEAATATKNVSQNLSRNDNNAGTVNAQLGWPLSSSGSPTSYTANLSNTTRQRPARQRRHRAERQLHRHDVGDGAAHPAQRRPRHRRRGSGAARWRQRIHPARRRGAAGGRAVDEYCPVAADG